MKTYPGVAVQETAGSDGVQEGFVCCDDVVQVLGLLHSVPKLIPGTLENLKGRDETLGRPILLKVAPTHHTTEPHCSGQEAAYLKGNVVLHLMNEVDHLGGQDVTLVQNPGELCKGQSIIAGGWRLTTAQAPACTLPSHQVLFQTPEQETSSPPTSVL